MKKVTIVGDLVLHESEPYVFSWCPSQGCAHVESYEEAMRRSMEFAIQGLTDHYIIMGVASFKDAHEAAIAIDDYLSDIKSIGFLKSDNHVTNQELAVKAWSKIQARIRNNNFKNKNEKVK